MNSKLFIWFLFILFFIPNILNADEYGTSHPLINKKSKNNSQKKDKALIQVSSFNNKKNALNFVKALKKHGKEAIIKKEIDKSGKTIYRVFIRKEDEKEKLTGNSNINQKSVSSIEPERVNHSDSLDSIKNIPEKHIDSNKENLIASYNIFESIEEADGFSNQIRESGFKPKIISKVTNDNKVVYAVFAEKIDSEKQPSIPENKLPEDTKEINILEKSPPLEKNNTTSEVQEKDILEMQKAEAELKTKLETSTLSPVEVKTLDTEKTMVLQKNRLDEINSENASVQKTLINEEPSKEEPPIGIPKEKKITASELFGRKGGYIHPFFAITEYYTDNVYNSRKDRESDFVTVLSPGIWMTLPHIYEKLLLAETSIMSPGGFSLSRYKPETFRRYQTYLFYNSDIELYSKDSSGNIVNHKAEGFFQYNLRGGLTFEFIDQYLASHDLRGTGISGKLDKFRTNLADLNIMYNVSDRLNFRLDYANYFVNYTASRNDFRDRIDNSLSAYVFYRFRPKTSLFYEYEFVDVNYDKDIMSDSTEHHNFLGIQWDITAKSKGSIKAGYGFKDFSESELDDDNEFILEAQIDHKITGKTSIILKASRKTNESNISTLNYMTSDYFQIDYLQKITGKITGNVSFSYGRNMYSDKLTLNGVTKKLRDNYLTGLIALQYKFKEWLEMDAGYILNKRESTFSDFDYTTNIIFIKLLGTL